MTPDDTAGSAGIPCWLELGTHDVGVAADFYAGLLGWRLTRQHDGVLASAGADPVAGIVPLRPELGAASRWTVFLAVDDLAATVAAATVAGATVAVSANAPGGDGVRTAHLLDPADAAVGLRQAPAGDGVRRQDGPGAPVWFELVTMDARTSVDFYAATFALQAERERELDYTWLVKAGRRVAGVLSYEDGLGPTGRPGWSAYVRTPDVEAAAARAVKLGGSVLTAPAGSAFGRFVTVRDPYGAVLSLVATPTSRAPTA